MGKLISLNERLLNQIILDKDLKKWWLAEQSDLHVTTLRRWLKGDIKKVRYRKLKSLANVLDIEAKNLVSEEKRILC